MIVTLRCLVPVVVSTLVGACMGSACEQTPDAYVFDVPVAMPAPEVPADNPMTDAKVALGRHLFFDARLSGNATYACASCHEPARAFTQEKALPIGSTGDVVPRNSMSLANAAYWTTYTWANPTLATLEEQALVPMFGEHPLELGMTGNEPTIYARLRDDPRYPPLFAAAFPGDEGDDVISRGHVAQALASFERSLLSGSSRYDRYVYGGEVDALSREEKRGMELFFSERTECYHCHGGPLFSTAFFSTTSPDRTPGFENNGLYNIDGAGAYPTENPGLFGFTHAPGDMGRFRIPTLRNVALTAPYMHDGSVATLDDVLAHYRAGGRTIADGPHAGVGSASPLKSSLVRPLDLDDAEIAALRAFLVALTDEAFVSDPRFQSPFAADDVATPPAPR